MAKTSMVYVSFAIVYMYLHILGRVGYVLVGQNLLISATQNLAVWLIGFHAPLDSLLESSV